MQPPRLLIISIMLFSFSVSAVSQGSNQTGGNPQLVDPEKLFKSVKALVEREGLTNKSEKELRRGLANKRVLSTSTIESYFALEAYEGYGSHSAAAKSTFHIKPNSEHGDIYGRLYSLGNRNELPEHRVRTALRACEKAVLATGNGTGTGGGIGSGSGIGTGPARKRNEPNIPRRLKYSGREFFIESSADKKHWRSSYLRLKTIDPKVDSRKYRGKNFGRCMKLIVPSPQVHYGLSFRNRPSTFLIKKTVSRFSAVNYRYEDRETYWLPAFDNDRRGLRHVFVVKLAAPFVTTKVFTYKDEIEGKVRKTYLNRLVVDLVGVWLYDPVTGAVVSDDATNPRLPLSDKTKKVVQTRNTVRGRTIGVRILSKPRPGYTTEAENENVRGTIRLRVTFLANGKIGPVVPIKGLPHGLTERAISAAKQIRFKPALRNGVPYTVRKTILYNFTLY